MKQSEHFANILNLKRQLEEIEGSRVQLEQDLDVDRSQLRGSRQQPNYAQEEDEGYYRSERKHRTSKKPMMVDATAEFNRTNYSDQDGAVEALVRELDEVKDSMRQKDLKIETLNFRTEKLQTELAMKLDVINKMTLEIEEKDAVLKRLSGQNKHLESVVEHNKTGLMPEHQRLKSQYDISLLEIKSLEKDNDILEGRIKELLQHNGILKHENRELKTTNFKIEQERLKLRQELETLKINIVNNENDYVDLSEKYEHVVTENDRLKNELIILKQKLEVYSTGDFDIVSKKMVSRFAKPEEEKAGSKSLGAMKKSVRTEKPERTERKSALSPIARNDGEKLNFDGINMMEQEFRRKLKD